MRFKGSAQLALSPLYPHTLRPLVLSEVPLSSRAMATKSAHSVGSSSRQLLSIVYQSFPVPCRLNPGLSSPVMPLVLARRWCSWVGVTRPGHVPWQSCWGPRRGGPCGAREGQCPQQSLANHVTLPVNGILVTQFDSRRTNKNGDHQAYSPPPPTCSHPPPSAAGG